MPPLCLGRSSLSASEPADSVDLSSASSCPRFSHIFSLCDQSRTPLPVSRYRSSFAFFQPRLHSDLAACKNSARRRRWPKWVAGLTSWETATLFHGVITGKNAAHRTGIYGGLERANWTAVMVAGEPLRFELLQLSGHPTNFSGPRASG